MFLIILADFGKLFTRGIKFLWAFVRRVYYTGSCRKVRRTVPVQVRIGNRLEIDCLVNFGFYLLLLYFSIFYNNINYIKFINFLLLFI